MKPGVKPRRRGALPYVGGYQVPDNRPPLLRRSYTQWPPFKFPLSYQILQIASHAFWEICKIWLEVAFWHTTGKWPPFFGVHVKKIPPLFFFFFFFLSPHRMTPLLFSMKSYTECPLLFYDSPVGTCMLLLYSSNWLVSNDSVHNHPNFKLSNILVKYWISISCFGLEWLSLKDKNLHSHPMPVHNFGPKWVSHPVTLYFFHFSLTRCPWVLFENRCPTPISIS